VGYLQKWIDFFVILYYAEWNHLNWNEIWFFTDCLHDFAVVVVISDDQLEFASCFENHFGLEGTCEVASGQEEMQDCRWQNKGKTTLFIYVSSWPYILAYNRLQIKLLQISRASVQPAADYGKNLIHYRLLPFTEPFTTTADIFLVINLLMVINYVGSSVIIQHILTRTLTTCTLPIVYRTLATIQYICHLHGLMILLLFN
jgi:hypothetical protein